MEIHHWESKGTYVINGLGRFFPQQIANINIRIWVGCIQSRNNLARTSWGSKDPVSTYMIVAGRVASNMPPWNHYIRSMDLIWLHVTIALLNNCTTTVWLSGLSTSSTTQQSKYTKVIPTIQACCGYAGSTCGCQSDCINPYNGQRLKNAASMWSHGFGPKHCRRIPLTLTWNDGKPHRKLHQWHVYYKSTCLEETQQTLGNFRVFASRLF